MTNERTNYVDENDDYEVYWGTYHSMDDPPQGGPPESENVKMGQMSKRMAIETMRWLCQEAGARYLGYVMEDGKFRMAWKNDETGQSGVDVLSWGDLASY